jgi:hypothetical protein
VEPESGRSSCDFIAAQSMEGAVTIYRFARDFELSTRGTIDQNVAKKADNKTGGRKFNVQSSFAASSGPCGGSRVDGGACFCRWFEG